MPWFKHILFADLHIHAILQLTANYAAKMVGQQVMQLWRLTVTWLWSSAAFFTICSFIWYVNYLTGVQCRLQHLRHEENYRKRFVRHRTSDEQRFPAESGSEPWKLTGILLRDTGAYIRLDSITNYCWDYAFCSR